MRLLRHRESGAGAREIALRRRLPPFRRQVRQGLQQPVNNHPRAIARSTFGRRQPRRPPSPLRVAGAALSIRRRIGSRDGAVTGGACTCASSSAVDGESAVGGPGFGRHRLAEPCRLIGRRGTWAAPSRCGAGGGSALPGDLRKRQDSGFRQSDFLAARRAEETALDKIIYQQPAGILLRPR